MIDRLLKYIECWTPVEIKNFYRKPNRRYKRDVKLSKKDKIPLSLAAFEDILRINLGIAEGKTLIIHSRFGNMNAGFSPQVAVDVLKKVVGGSGNLMMPFYPNGHAYYWIQEGEVFDVYKSRSYRGILTQTFKGATYYSVSNESMYLHSKKLLEMEVSRTVFSQQNNN